VHRRRILFRAEGRIEITSDDRRWPLTPFGAVETGMSGGRTLRKHAQLIFAPRSRPILPKQSRHLRVQGNVLIASGTRYRLRDFDKIHVIGAGKGASAMAAARPWGALRRGVPQRQVQARRAELRWLSKTVRASGAGCEWRARAPGNNRDRRRGGPRNL
jgi:hypothetical protein